MRSVKLGLAAVTLMTTQPASADTVTDWWDVANRYFNAAQGAPGSIGPDGLRASTRATLAMFEAVNAIDRRYESYLKLPAADPKASQDAAAATAAFKVLQQHYPANKAALEESYTMTLAAIPDGAAKQSGVAIGEQAAAAAMAANGVDATVPQSPYRPRTTPGEWVATALPTLESYWVALKPWAADSPDALRAPPPPDLTSERYARDYEEVRRLGGKASKERTPHQTLIARYRQGFDVTPSIRMATDQPGRRPVDNARLLTLYQMAFDDSAQGMVAAKIRYNYWRPITAIRNGAEDGNPVTQPDPAWLPLLGTPNFQEYPCGHCTVVAAIAEVMNAESDLPAGTAVAVASLPNPNSTVQRVASWDELVRQVSDSRMLGGVHYRFSNEAGEEIGRKAARMVLENQLRPLPGKKRR
jgi:hypothetical protein